MSDPLLGLAPLEENLQQAMSLRRLLNDSKEKRVESYTLDAAQEAAAKALFELVTFQAQRQKKALEALDQGASS